MTFLRRFLSRIGEDILLLVLLIALVPLLWLTPERVSSLHELVDWKTIGALTGLLVLSRGLEDSGYLAHAGRQLLARIHGERTLAALLVLFSAALAAVVTNDVALFIVVPLTLGLRAVANLPIGRLVIFEALAVNAGSTLSPVGNPQNLFLWQSSPLSFLDFTLAMLPLGLALLVLLVAAVPFGFPAARITLSGAAAVQPVLDRRLLRTSLACYTAFLILADLGLATWAALAVVATYFVFQRRVLRGVDWLLPGVFVLMFVDLGLLAGMPALRELATSIDRLPGGVFTAGILLSQLISNVPAAIFLSGFTDDVRALAWGVSVGGFGIAIGSLANLIALRLARQPGLWREFHYWSVPALLIGGVAALVLSSTHA
ncbi:MAG TPA: SLC13 family permease [Rhodocyclaceae bacterium]|nr:SLC13 family permease [Rhodocyclaceae bacterium]HRQ48012.1 SLC13 family permease [Rhodocyclaceae bacterium]